MCNLQTGTSFQWIKPMICNPELPDSVSLPADSELIDCLACNPGMHLSNSSCTYCPENHRSDGMECVKCDANTAPDYAYMFENWNVIPEELTLICISFTGAFYNILQAKINVYYIICKDIEHC